MLHIVAQQQKCPQERAFFWASQTYCLAAFLALRLDFLALWALAFCFLISFAGAGAAAGVDWTAGATGAAGAAVWAKAPTQKKPAIKAVRSLFI